MRFHRRDQEDKINSLNRCYFDAQQSRAELALLRLQDLHEEFPRDAKLTYAEALIRKDYLGQGWLARELFQQAYELDHTHAFAACNAAVYAVDEDEFDHWAEISLRVAPADQVQRRFVDEMRSNLEQGTEIWQHHSSAATDASEAGNYGESAARAELVLHATRLARAEQASLRRFRAERLRQIDAGAQRHRETLGEAFPPEERLALQEALSELERAINLDEYDASAWNLRSAWCIYLGRCEEALSFAERAIELRPFHYPKPHHNKARALSLLGRQGEALASAEEALKQSEGDEYAADASMARQLIEEFSAPSRVPTVGDLQPLVTHILNAATVTSEQEMGEHQKADNALRPGQPSYASVDTWRDGLLQRTAPLRGQWDMSYIGILAQLLTYWSAETAFLVVLKTAQRDGRVQEHCLHAALYLTVHSDGVMRRDAARFLALSLLGGLEGEQIRKAYRLAIVETSAAARGPLAELDTIMRAELARINPQFPELIADQEPVDDEGRRRAQRTILRRFGETQAPMQAASQPGATGNPSGAPPGVLTMLLWALACCVSGILLLSLPGGLGRLIQQEQRAVLGMVFRFELGMALSGSVGGFLAMSLAVMVTPDAFSGAQSQGPVLHSEAATLIPLIVTGAIVGIAMALWVAPWLASSSLPLRQMSSRVLIGGAQGLATGLLSQYVLVGRADSEE